jgi:DNA-binding transcriptional regulator LsrR (DeoR family)
MVQTMVGILVHGNTHSILSGPRPTAGEAVALARNWSVVQIGETKSQKFEKWEIRNKEFRANLQWAVIVPGERETSPGVLELLAEMAARGVEIQRYLAQDT